MVEEVVVIYGGELARDVAEQVEAKKLENIKVTLRNASERPKTLLDLNSTTVVCFILQTIENESPTEDGGVCVRFFQRKTHSETLLKDKFKYSILGLGDSNLLLDRQTTTGKDCNQVAIKLDKRLELLGGTKQYDTIGMADERHDLQEVEPWIIGFWNSIKNEN